MYVVVISIVARLPTKGGVSPPPFSLLLKLCHQIEIELSRHILRSRALPVSIQSIYGIALLLYTTARKYSVCSRFCSIHNLHAYLICTF